MTQINKHTQNDDSCGCGDPGLTEVLDADLFQALADPNRLALIERLCGCCASISVTDVSDCCNVDFSVVSRHLKTLERAGIVEAEKHGREVRYTLKSEEVVRQLREMADAVESACSEGAISEEVPGEDE